MMTPSAPPPCPRPEYLPGAPVQSPPGQFTFVPVEGARCIDNSPTGMALNPHPNPESENLLLFLQGGGVCFEPFTCLFTQGVRPFGPDDLKDALLTKDGAGLWDRDDPNNPFAGFHFAFIPYCTGDAHAGSGEVDGYQHRGYENMDLYLKRIVATFPNVKRVLLAGSSSGGLGALLNYPRVQDAFRCVPVHLLSDSGVLFGDDYIKPCLQAQWRERWNLDSLLPSECDACRTENGGGLVHYLPYLAERYPTTRIALLLSDADKTLKRFFGFGYLPSCKMPWLMPQDRYAEGIRDLVDEIMPPFPNFNAFIRAGDEHPFFLVPPHQTEVAGVNLADWINQFLDDDPHWSSITPPPNRRP